jgi:hypothetical protein
MQEFVRNGGYLVVTGTDLEMLPQLVPSIIGCYSSQLCNQNFSGLCVDAELTKAAAPLAKGLRNNSRWSIPYGCPLLKILDPSKVSVLVVSQFIKEHDPQGDGVLAALLPYGGGYILCFAGNINARNVEFVPDSDRKMHIRLLEGLLVNFMVSGLRGGAIVSSR